MTAYQRLKKRIYKIVGPAEHVDKYSALFDVALCSLVLLSCTAVVIELFHIPDAFRKGLEIFEYVTVGLFIVEYFVRLWVCEYQYPECPNKGAAIWEFITSFDSLVDLLSIVPVFVANLPTATGILKIFKLCKILRLVKASRYLSGIANFGRAIQKKKKQIIMSIIAMVVLVMICSVLLYSVENKAQPEVFNNAFSGVIYSIQTIFDSDSEVVLTTPAGQALSTLMLLIGGCMIGVPIAIIATGFEDMIAEQAGEEKEDKDLYEVLRDYDKLSETEKERFQRLIEVDTRIE